MGAKPQKGRHISPLPRDSRLARWAVLSGLTLGTGLLVYWWLMTRVGATVAAVLMGVAAAGGLVLWAMIVFKRRSGATDEDGAAARSRVTGMPGFFGPGHAVRLALGAYHDPLTYLCKGRLREPFDPSLIELGLKVSPAEAARVPALPDWPSYREATPGQRAMYQRWLIDGRRDPRIPIGYVFIFFCGLERRVLIDGRDHATIAEEVLRLRSLYGEASHSFRRYATNLLWHTIRRGVPTGEVPGALLDSAVRTMERRDEDALLLCLAVLHDLKRPVPGELALRLAERDQRTTNSVVVRRHREMFERLFFKRYAEQHGQGITLRAGKRPRRVRYDPASAFLGREAGARLELETPDCLRIGSQFKPLVAIWESCIEELRGYDKAARRSEGETLTAEMYEQLPEELRTQDHPEFEVWWRIKERHADEEEWSIVPVSVLAEAKAIEPRRKLTITQSRKILQSADAMGLAIEPDARVTGRAYRWDEPVCMFIAERDERPSGRYLAAATLLRLGMTVAEADGEVDEAELDQITTHLEQQLDLSDAEAERLEQLEHLLIREGARAELLTKGLIESLSKAHRTAVGGYLVGVAAADGVITANEHKALRKLYRRLSLDDGELDTLLAGAEPSGQATDAGTSGEPVEIQPARSGDGGERLPPRRGFTLDRDRLRDVRQQTDQVAAILTEAMAAGNDQEDADEAESPPEPSRMPSAEQPAPHDTEQTGEPSISTGSDATPSTGPPRFRPNSGTPAASVTATDRPAADVEDAEAELDDRLRPFVEMVIERADWPRHELRELADRHGLMLAGAIDEVNEWTEARFGDRLIEEDGATYRVDAAIMENP